MSSTQENEGRAGFAAIVGRPNVGKSTLLNRLLGEKLSIVSNRPQTTRNRILGIRTWMDGDAVNQLVLVDTPGIHHRRANLNRFMVREALDSLDGVDCVVLMSEAPVQKREPRETGEALALHPQDEFLLKQVAAHGTGAPVVVALNKIDRSRNRRLLLPVMAAWAERGFNCIVPISALTGDGVPALLDEVLGRVPIGPPLFPQDQLTDRPERFLVAELIREQVFIQCREEIPYAAAVEVHRFEDRPARGKGRRRRPADVCIEATIHVEQEGQKAILIGRGGQMIRSIGTAARQEISRILGCPVLLGLTIHVEPRWSKTPSGRRKLGYE